MIRSWAINLLACPMCLAGVKVNKQKMALVCGRCGAEYKVKGDIIKLVIPTNENVKLMNVYDSIANVYDSAYNNPEMRYRADVEWKTIHIKNNLAGNICLDVGCGTGLQTLKLAEAGKKVIAIDISEKMLKVLHKKACKKRLLSRIVLIQSPANILPLKSNSVDMVISMFGGLQHSKAFRRPFESVGRVIKKEGLFIFSVCNKEGIPRWHKIAQEELDKEIMDFEELGRITDKHLAVFTHYFTSNKIKKVLKTNGFKIVKLGGIFILFPPAYAPSTARGLTKEKQKLAGLENIIRWKKPFNKMGEYFICIATKK